MRDIVLFLDVPNAGSTAMYYQTARSLELLPVLVTTYPSGGGKAADADRLRVSRMDLATILSAIDRIGRERIAGVFSAGSSQAELAARIAAALGRPHADPHAISLCNDKHRLREFLTRRGLNTVAYHHATTLSDAAGAVESFGGAVVLKPLSSTGSNGVRICRTPDEALSHARRLLKWKRNGLLVEKYIDAPQYSVECFDGVPLNVKQLHFSDGPFPIIIGIDAPAALTQDRLEELKDYSGSIINEVGLSDGPSFMELRYSGEQKYLIEINPRPSLDSPIELYVATGIDITDLCLKFACGIPYGRDSFVKAHENRACAGRHLIRNGSSVRADQRG